MTYKCRFDGCQCTFQSRNGRRKHESKHTVMNDDVDDFGGCDYYGTDCGLSEPTTTVSQMEDALYEERTNTFLRFAMTLESQYSVPRSAVDEMFRVYFEDQKKLYKHFASHYNIEESHFKNIEANMSVLLNSKKRSEVIAEKFFEVLPEKMTIDGQDIYHLPLSGLLQELFKHKETLDLVDSSELRASTDGSYRDICDGEVFKQSEFFQTYKDALQFLLFMDECYLNDSVEYMMIYCAIGNLPSWSRCDLRNILPLAAIPSSLLKLKGQSVLVLIMQEFIPFSSHEGVDIKIHNGAFRKFRGQVIACLLDHKAAHELGGFFANFSNMKRFCRHCLLHRDECVTRDRSKFVVRDPEDHDRIIKVIAQGTYTNSLQKLYGVHGYSTFQILPGFHVCTNLPPDLMHTELEGELKRELCFFLDHCINTAKWFSIEDFNNALCICRQSLDLKAYLPDMITDKFYKNITSSFLTAAQIYSLATMIPYICTKFPTANDITQSLHFQCFTKHLRYLEIAMQWEFTHADLLKLDDLIDEHFDLWCQVYPNKFVPKSHYRFHFTEAVKMFGPLVGIYCMRYEAKHQIMKRLVRNSNHHNDAKTLLIRTLQYMNSNDIEPDFIIRDTSNVHNREREQVVSNCFFPNLCVLVTTLTLKYRGTQFNVNDFILTTSSYAKLVKIYVKDGDEVWLVVTQMTVVNHAPRLGYPLIRETDTRLYMPFSQVRGRLTVLTVANSPNVMVVHTASSTYV